MRAVKHAGLEADMFPPFTGFPREGIAFLTKLKKNNKREWFNEHKPEFEEYVKPGMLNRAHASPSR